MSMHPDFAHWYSSVVVDPAEGVLQKRWAAVEELSENLTAELTLSLLKFFVLRKAAQTTVPDALAEALKKHDEPFRPHENLEEVRLLAGVVLRQGMATSGTEATRIALGLVCGFFSSRAAVAVDKEHLDYARTYLVTQGRALREIKKPKPIELQPFSKEKYVELLPAALFAPPQLPQLHEQLFGLLAHTDKIYRVGFQQAQTSVGALWDVISAQREEINFLWWLQNAYSRHLDRQFQEIGYQVGALLFPMELADLTELVPGPEALFGLLLTALQKSGMKTPVVSTSISEAVNSTPRAWRERMAGLHNVDVQGGLCPILLAIKTSLTTDGEQEWQPVYRKACDISSDSPMPISDLSLQLYVERLFVRVTGEP